MRSPVTGMTRSRGAVHAMASSQCRVYNSENSIFDAVISISGESFYDAQKNYAQNLA